MGDNFTEQNYIFDCFWRHIDEISIQTVCFGLFRPSPQPLSPRREKMIKFSRNCRRQRHLPQCSGDGSDQDGKACPSALVNWVICAICYAK